jgi:crotonobetainyl-CoA:carnitine CoA-transferase CaiB-like acyl-CoA transferase
MLSDWTAGWEKGELADRLQRAGVAAAPVNSAAEVLRERQVRARDSFVWIDRKHVGSHPYPGVTARLAATPGAVRSAAPCLGEDNRFVLAEIVGLARAEIEELERDGVIGDWPDDG